MELGKIIASMGFSSSRVPSFNGFPEFKPISNLTLKMSRVSEDQLTKYVVASEGHRDSTSASQCRTQLQIMNPGQYIACMYDEHWWLGNIIACG